jgi:hypothetical protein
MYGDEHDDGYSQTGGSYCAAVYQQRTELTSTNYPNLDIVVFKAFEGGVDTFFKSPDKPQGQIYILDQIFRARLET